jgi:hypothetical protein
MFAQQDMLCRIAREAQRDLNLGAGTPEVVYRALKPYMRSFHITDEQFISLADKPDGLHISSAIETIWPFDVFEIVIDGGARQELQGTSLALDAESHLMRVAIAQWSYPPGRYEQGVIDHEWMVFDVTKYPDGRIEYGYVSFMRGQPDGEYRFLPWPPFGQKNPLYAMWLPQLENGRWQTQDKPYWTKLLSLCKQLADALQHSSVGATIIPDPERPSTRQQRRAVGYIEADHYQITLRARTQLSSVLNDVRAGKSLHPWARRRHRVIGHSRRYSSGKVVRVREHMRGGKYGMGPQYDATAFPLEGTAVRQRSNVVEPPS